MATDTTVTFAIVYRKYKMVNENVMMSLIKQIQALKITSELQ